MPPFYWPWSLLRSQTRSPAGFGETAGLSFWKTHAFITSAEVIDLTNGGIDLGRHLKNGELLLSQILHTNFYSYTQPELNHHWLAGIVFYSVYKLDGFPGLNAFYILLAAFLRDHYQAPLIERSEAARNSMLHSGSKSLVPQ